MPTSTATGTEINVHKSTCSPVPTIAWKTPPPLLSKLVPPASLVHQAAWKTTFAPLLMTVHNSQTSGTSATQNASVTMAVATLFLNLREPRALAKVRLGSGAVVSVLIQSPSSG